MNSYQSYTRYHYNKSVFRDIPENNKLLKNFDSELQTFYHDVICREFNLSAAGKVPAIKKAMREISHAYKKPTVESNASRILFDTSEKRCAYVMKHCACFGSAVARNFLRLLRSNPSIAEATSRRRRIELCCLGGGPGTEAVAIAKVIGSLLPDSVHLSQKLELRVRVLDISGDWTTTVRSVLRALNETEVFFERDRMEVTFVGLLETDLTDPNQWDETVKGALREADVITMVYFVSAVNGSRARRKCASMLKNIVDAAKPDCLLFFLDSAKDLHYNTVKRAACQDHQNSRTTLIYGPRRQEFHNLTTTSVRKFMDLYFRRFEAIFCLTDCFVTSAGWTKNRNETGSNHSVSLNRQQPEHRCSCFCQNGISGRKWRKLVDSNTRKQELFRERVERMLRAELGMDFVTDDENPKESRRSHWERESLEGEDWPTVVVPETLYASKSKQKRIFTAASVLPLSGSHPRAITLPTGTQSAEFTAARKNIFPATTKSRRSGRQGAANSHRRKRTDRACGNVFE